MNTVETTVTIHNELSTSTCTPTGGGASTCTYQYTPRTSTTTSTTTGILATSTVNYQTVSMVTDLTTIAIILMLAVAMLTKKLVE